jgi:hypothetical protein
MLGETGGRLEAFLRKLLATVPQQTGVFASSARNTTNLLHLHPHKTALFRKLHDTDSEAKPSVVHAEKIDSTLVSLSAKLGCVSVAKCTLRLTNWITMLMQQVSLHYIKLGVWCT